MNNYIPNEAACSRLKKMSREHHNRHHEKIAIRCLSKNVEDLTDEEKMSIFIAYGVPTKYENGKLVTIHKVELKKASDGRWLIGIKANG